MNDVKYPELPEHSVRLMKWKAPHPPQVTICARTFEEYTPEPDSEPYWKDHAPLFTADQMRSYADATCALWGAQKESGWIRVEERMPEEEQTVFCTGFIENNPANARWAAVAVHHAGSFCDVETGHVFYPPTHWKPLDLPTPEGEAK